MTQYDGTQTSACQPPPPPPHKAARDDRFLIISSYESNNYLIESKNFASNGSQYRIYIAIILSETMSTQRVGGLKGFFQRAGKSFSQAGGLAKDWSMKLAPYVGRIGLFLASTSMVVLMPMIFEINREHMVRILGCLTKFVIISGLEFHLFSLTVYLLLLLFVRLAFVANIDD